MDHFAGLDVSVKDTSICIVDDTGRITREVKVASEPDALLAVLLKLQQTGAYSITSSAWKADYMARPRHL
jgi:predicted NBD/HSP70 family sugar kinase